MSRPEHRWTYPAAVERVVDGDTLDLVIDQGFKSYKRIRVRVYGVDTPERGQEGFHAAIEGVYGFLNETRRAWFSGALDFPLLFESHDGKLDSFGRYLGRLWSGEVELGASLLAEGLAEVYQR